MALAVPCSRVVAPATGVAKGNSTWREPRKADPLAVSEEVLGAFPFLLPTGGGPEGPELRGVFPPSW